MKLIVGLGNPGKDYNNTRHNIGFMVLDNYLGEVKWSEEFDGLTYKTVIQDEKCIFLKPTTYMNNSGISIRKIVDYYKINIEDILIIQDDLDVEIGKIKFKIDSSSGGHNGIKSIINHLGTQSFARIKLGIKTETTDDVIDYVLGKFSKKELDLINYDLAGNIINSFIKNGREYTLGNYNQLR